MAQTSSQLGMTLLIQTRMIGVENVHWALVNGGEIAFLTVTSDFL